MPVYILRLGNILDNMIIMKHKVKSETKLLRDAHVSECDDRLLPCPFCGSPAEFEYNDYNFETGEGDDGMGEVRCTNIECGVRFFDDYDSAVKKWNRRVNDCSMIDIKDSD